VHSVAEPLQKIGAMWKFSQIQFYGAF